MIKHHTTFWPSQGELGQQISFCKTVQINKDYCLSLPVCYFLKTGFKKMATAYTAPIQIVWRIVFLDLHYFAEFSEKLQNRPTLQTISRTDTVFKLPCAYNCVTSQTQQNPPCKTVQYSVCKTVFENKLLPLDYRNESFHLHFQVLN